MIVERHILGLPVLGTRCMTIRFSFLLIKFSFLSEREILSIHDLISLKVKVLQSPTRQRQLPCPVVSRHSMCHASLDLMWHWPCVGSLMSRFFLLLYYTKGMTLPFFHWQGILGLAHLSYKSKPPKRDPEKDRTFLTIKCLQDFAIETSEVTGLDHIRSSPAWPPNIIFQFS